MDLEPEGRFHHLVLRRGEFAYHATVSELGPLRARHQAAHVLSPVGSVMHTAVAERCRERASHPTDSGGEAACWNVLTRQRATC